MIDTKFLEISPGNSHVVFPSIKKPRWIIPLHSWKHFVSNIHFVHLTFSKIKYLKNLFYPIYIAIKFFRINTISIINREQFKSISSLDTTYYIGSPGPYQKLLLFTYDFKVNRPIVYKCALAEKSNQLVCHEIDVLNTKTEYMPQLLDSKKSDKISFFSMEKVNGTQVKQWNLTVEKFYFNSKMVIPSNYYDEFKSQYNKKLSQLEIFLGKEEIKRIRNIYNIILNEATPEQFFSSIAHGDFAPWNLLLDESKGIKIIDWEYSSRHIQYYDLFHFFFHPILIKKSINNSLLLDTIAITKSILKRNNTRVDYQIYAITFAFELVIFYLESQNGKNYSEHTIQNYLSFTNHFLQSLNKEKLSGIL